MTDRSPAEAMLAEYRRSILPRDADGERVWARLERGDAGTDGAAPVGPDRRAWWVAAAVLVAAAAVLAVLRPAPEHRAVHELDPHEQSVHARDAAASQGARVVQPPEPPVPAELPPVRVEARAPTPAPTSPLRPIAADPLRAELQAISAARAALDRGDADDALGRVAAYRRRFGAGVLAVEARAIGAAARCRKGPIEDGRAQARALLVDAAAAAYRDLLRDACALQ